MNFRRLGSIVVKELRQLRRDRLTFAMIIGIPTMQLVLFGYAINMDVRHLEAAVLDQANTARSRELVAAMATTEVMNFGRRVQSQQEVDALLREGKISAALILPPDFDTRLERRDRPAAQIVVDGSEQVVQAAARQLASYPLYDDTGWTSTVRGVEVVNFYNPERRAAVNTVPGLVGVILTMTMVLFTAIALVRERERGNLEMLIATPVSSRFKLAPVSTQSRTSPVRRFSSVASRANVPAILAIDGSSLSSTFSASRVAETDSNVPDGGAWWNTGLRRPSQPWMVAGTTSI